MQVSIKILKRYGGAVRNQCREIQLRDLVNPPVSEVEFRDLKMVNQGVPAEGRGAGQQHDACKGCSEQDELEVMLFFLSGRHGYFFAGSMKIFSSISAGIFP